jgi:hypothetical protein
MITCWEECGPCPVFASYTLAFALQLRKKHGKPSVRVAEGCQLALWKQNILNVKNEHIITITVTSITFSCNYEHYLVTPINFLGSFPGVKSGWCVTLTPHPLLVPLVMKEQSYTSTTLWAVRPVQSLSACTRVTFTFTFNNFLSWQNARAKWKERKCT